PFQLSVCTKQGTGIHARSGYVAELSKRACSPSEHSRRRNVTQEKYHQMVPPAEVPTDCTGAVRGLRANRFRGALSAGLSPLNFVPSSSTSAPSEAQAYTRG